MTGQLTADLAAFFAECVYPAEAEFAADGGTGSIDSPVLTRVAEEARRRGLWNLFSSLHPARLVVSDPETADLAEIVGRSPVIGQVARSLRISDGPDEVHRQVVGRYELARRK